MRNFETTGNVSVNVIAGNHAVLLGFDASAEGRKGLLGFAIRRTALATGEQKWLRGSLAFEGMEHEHTPGDPVLESRRHPIQDFRWSDYEAEPDTEYSYDVIPLYGRPDDLHEGPVCSVRVRTEPVDHGAQAVFFNRAVAGSQGYVSRFGDKQPDEVPDRAAYQWLSRGLEEGLLAFIEQAQDARFGLRAALYEFHYEPVLQAFKAAHERGAAVEIVYDYKHPDGSPGRENLEAITKVGIEALTIPRTQAKSAIAHNKFIVLLQDDQPIAVWTGSTNITRGAIFGHSNVGHVVRDPAIAGSYLGYWAELAKDPAAKTLRPFNEAHSPVSPSEVDKHAIFSPRASLEALDAYAQAMHDSPGPVFLTAAFGISNELRDVLIEERDYLRYVLMDNPGQTGNRGNYEQVREVRNNRIALGDVVRAEGELAGWHEEHLTDLNAHVKYVHTKYMLLDPFGEHPIVITGSANFSDASTTKNDENMLVLRDCPAVMDVYVTEFMRMFTHFEFRNKLNASWSEHKQAYTKYLRPDDSWTDRHFVEGSVAAEERELFGGSALMSKPAPIAAAPTLIRDKAIAVDDLDSSHLSTSKGDALLLDRYRLMQRGLIYPAPYARFVSCWAKPAPSITREDVRRVMVDLREQIHRDFGSRNTTVVVGVNFELYRRWCEQDRRSVPQGMRYAFPIVEDGRPTSAVFARSRGVFQDAGADLWFHIKSDEHSHLAGVFERLEAALAGLVDSTRTVHQDCNQRVREGAKAGRVLGRRFAENLNNPTDPVTIANHTLVGLDDVDHVGGSFVLAQRFAVNWDRLHQMTEGQVEEVIGRTSNDVILPSRDRRSHIKSARQQDRQGNTTFVMRLGLPYGNSSQPSANQGDEAGIYFAGFAKRVDVLENIMSAQIGSIPGFMNDRLFDNVRSDLGGFFYVPSRADLDLELDQWASESARDWTSFPGIDWSRLSRHFTAKSPNGRMYYNHKNYLFEMATMSAEDRARFAPPSTRILTLLMDSFARWQDTWYFAKGQDEMGSLHQHIAADPEFGPSVADEVMRLSIIERKGWATRMQCRLYTSEAYGYRGRREVDGQLRPGADTYRIHPQELIVGALPDLSLGQGRYCMSYLRDEEQEPAFFRGLSEASGVGHVLPDHQKLVDLGIAGLLAEIDQRAKQADADKQPFYAGCRIALHGVQDQLERYAALAESMIPDLGPGQAAERHNLAQIAERCRKLRTAAPESMIEAAQLIFTVHSCLHLNGEPVSIGRLDQYLGRFYTADIAAGRLDPERAQELIDALWLKFAEKILQNRIFIADHQPYGNLAMGGTSGPYPQGASLGQWIMQVTVGGWAGDDAEQPTPADNEVTRLCIRAAGRLPLNAPCLSLRVSADTPTDLLEEAARALLSGGAHPILLHDDKIVAGLLQSGDAVGQGDPCSPSASTPVAAKAGGCWSSQVSRASARNYACDGCYEPMFTGQNWFSLGGFTTLAPLECALNQGRTYASAGETFLHGQNLSFRSKSAEAITNFDELLDLYYQHFRALWAKAFDGQLSSFDAIASICPAPLLSILTDDCLAKGLDIYAGGARYNVYAPCWIGLSTTINSLWNIKRMVFDDDSAVTSLPELLECLMCDWGHKMVEPMVSSLLGPTRLAEQALRFQRLREVAMSMPRYGEGHAEIDAFGNAVVERIAALTVDVLRNPAESTAAKMLAFAERYGTPEQPFGGFQIQPGTGTFENFSAFGAGSGASADGRRLNAPIASDMSPSPGWSDAPADPTKVGFEAALTSSAAAGPAAMWDGAPVDFNIDELFPEQTLTAMLRRFADGCGSNILTVTTASPSTFAEAPDQPEAYDLLRVRMGGWSEYFTSMFPTSQVQHQRRPLMTEPSEPTGSEPG